MQLVPRASADLVSLEYYDASATNPAFGGPLWTGVIDTVTNKLRIDSWTELPLHSSPEFWTPADLPLIWNAVDANGAPFDVTHDNLFDAHGQINFGSDALADAANDFAFISPRTIQSMNWHPFDSDAGAPDTNTIVNYVGSIEFYIGWGGYAFNHPVNGLTYRISQNTPSIDELDYRTVQALPNNPEGVGASTAALVTVTGIFETQEAVIVAVPEASAVLGLSLVAAVSAARRLRRRGR